MATIHAMADFETLGVRPTSAVLSLGAVAFNSEGVLEDTFYVNIDSADCINLASKLFQHSGIKRRRR